MSAAILSPPFAPPTAPPAAPIKQIVTAAELLELSQKDENRYELIAGEVIVVSPAGIEHGYIAIRIGARIQIFVEDHNLGYVFAAETGFRLESNPDTVRTPDVSFVRAERLQAGKLPKSYFPGAPDLAVEVVSPHDRAGDVQEKVQDWLSHGTQLVWVVEPSTRTLTVYRADGSVALLKMGDSIDGEDVLPGFSYPLDRLFA